MDVQDGRLREVVDRISRTSSRMDFKYKNILIKLPRKNSGKQFQVCKMAAEYL